ncbi:MAG TPA: ribonuclease Y [Phycisphaerales bacterium]|nr:ribonuclease Y [Phycisphaerales bacterium]
MSVLHVMHATMLPASSHAPAVPPLTLAAFETLEVILIIVALLVGIAVGFFLVRTLTNQTIASAKSEAKKLVDDARNQAQVEAEKARVEGEKALLEKKSRMEAEIEKDRDEVREQEKRLGKREDLVDRKEETLSQRESQLSRQSESIRQREELISKRDTETQRIYEQQKDLLTSIAGMSRHDAKELLLKRVEEDARHDVAKVTRKLIEDAENEAKSKAREITLMAIQRYAAEHSSESTVRSVAIPSDDMKGRIIGREGRNIRAIEKATGVDIIVDDTPGVIVVSCFDKVRQAIAVESLERLIADGRMHPTRIEEVVEKVKSEIGEKIMKFGKEAALEVNLRGLHPKVIEAMGKLHYRTSYGQNVLRHSIEVGFLCQIIAEQLGLDGAIARRCGFLHDIGKAMDHEMEGGHPKIGMDFARQFGEKEPVLNAIGGHHADIPSTSFYTPIVMAADAVSSARPGARRESLEKYVQRLNELQDIALSFKGVNEAHAIQAGREVRVMIDADKVDDDEAYLIAHQIAKRVSEEMTFPGEIRVTVLRETRAIEYAR